MPKRTCPTCLKEISYTNFSRHVTFQHSYCKLCGEFHSSKKHRRKVVATAADPAAQHPELSQFIPLLVPIYFPTHVYHLLLQAGVGGGWVAPLAEQIQNWIMDENRRNCRACEDDSLIFVEIECHHTCSEPPPTTVLMDLYFDKVCRDHAIYFTNPDMYQQL